MGGVRAQGKAPGRGADSRSGSDHGTSISLARPGHGNGAVALGEDVASRRSVGISPSQVIGERVEVLKEVAAKKW